jgi:hypothetical protein
MSGGEACGVVTLISTVSGVLMSGWAVRWYYTEKVGALRKALEEFIAENAKVKVAMAASEMTEEGRQVCKMTLAALGAAFPEKQSG